MRRARAPSCRAPRDVLDQPRPTHLPRRHVDAHREVSPPARRCAPASGLATRLGEHPAPDLDDSSRLLGERDELRRRQQAARRMLPADERLRRRRSRRTRARRSAGSGGRTRRRCRRGGGRRRARAGRRGPRPFAARRRRTAPSRCAFARYMATSADRSSSSASSPTAMPTLAVTNTSRPSRSNGVCSVGDHPLGCVERPRRPSRPRPGSRTRHRPGARPCASATARPADARRPPARACHRPGGRGCR